MVGSVSRLGESWATYAEEHDLGRVMSNDSGIITERDPDTVRGADVAYYSYARLPKGPLPAGYGPEVPELVIEVRSSGDSWREILHQGRRVSDGRCAEGRGPRSPVA